MDDELLRLLETGTITELETYFEKVYLTFRNLNPGKELDFLSYIEESITWITGSGKTKSREKFIYDWTEEKRTELKAEVKASQTQVEKIKWNGTPEIFGFLFLELIRKGYIDVPLHHGKPNFTGFSRLCWEHFEIKTTPGNLERALNEENNRLTDWKRDQFKIPQLSEID